MALAPHFISFVYQYYVLEVPCVDMNITEDIFSNADIFYGSQVTTVWSRNESLKMEPGEDMVTREQGLEIGRITYHCPHIRGSWSETLASVECGDMDTLLWWLDEVYQHYCDGMQRHDLECDPLLCVVLSSLMWLGWRQKIIKGE